VIIEIISAFLGSVPVFRGPESASSCTLSPSNPIFSEGISRCYSFVQFGDRFGPIRSSSTALREVFVIGWNFLLSVITYAHMYTEDQSAVYTVMMVTTSTSALDSKPGEDVPPLVEAEEDDSKVCCASFGI